MKVTEVYYNGRWIIKEGESYDMLTKEDLINILIERDEYIENLERQISQYENILVPY